MGKKTSDGKEKKLLRKAETERVHHATSLTKEANLVTDLLRDFPAFKVFNRNGLTAELAFFWSKDMQPELQDWAFNLCKQNMQAMYESVWGWKDAKKRSELQHEEARFLVAFEVPPEAAGYTVQAGSADTAVSSPAAGEARSPLAFIHFRFEVEDSRAVLYVWDIQLEGRAKRKGLGKLLMKLLELIAFKLQLQEVMLTVMKANTSAVAMYEQLGYSKHHSCPEDGVDGQPGYLILSKSLPEQQRPPLRAAVSINLQ